MMAASAPSALPDTDHRATHHRLPTHWRRSALLGSLLLALAGMSTAAHAQGLDADDLAQQHREIPVDDAGTQALPPDQPQQYEASAESSHSADPDQGSASAQLPGITVTAKGYEAESASTPIATTVLDRDDLTRKQATNVGDALKHEPGLAVNSDSAQGQNPVVRGLSRESIVLMADGMRFNSAQPAGAIGSFLSLGLAERVEVVKGAASVLYGTGALGGAINVRLPQARFEPGLKARGGLQFDSASRGWLGSAVLNTSAEDHALMLGVMAGRYKDYESAQGKVPRTGYKTQAVIGQYRYRIDARQQLRLSVQNHEDKDLWYGGSTRPHVNPRVGSLTTHSPKQHRRLYELGYSHRPSPELPLDIDARIYRQEMERRIYGYANGLGQDISMTDVTFVTDGIDAKVGWQFHPQHLVSIGTNLWRMRANPNARQVIPPNFGTFVPAAPFRNGELQAAGVYIQDDIRIDRWQILAGLRHDRVKGSAGSMNNGQVTQGLDRSDSATSASLGVLYEVNPLLRPYLNIARAFRAADMRERYQSGLRSDGFYYAGSPQISPETATQFELGLKGSTPTVDYSVAVYHNRINDYLTGVELTGAEAVAACGQANAAACKRNVNLGRATLNGADASLRWQFVPQQWLRLGYSMVRGKNKDLDEPLYQMPADRLSVGWEQQYNAQWSFDADLYLVRRQDRVATRFTRGREDATAGYGLIDVGATWRFTPGQQLRLAVRNLADKGYHDHLSEGLAGAELMAPGRSVQLSWQGNF